MWLCKDWNLPDEIAEVVGYHHTPLLAQKYVKEARIMHLADSISTNYYERLLGNSTTFVHTEKIMKQLDIDKEFVEDMIKKLPTEIEKSYKKIVFFTE
jgi:HD-like signal output (HDOD) protein